MFNFSVLPFSTSDTIYRNGEVFELTLNINRLMNLETFILSNIECVLNIDRNQIITLWIL